MVRFSDFDSDLSFFVLQVYLEMKPILYYTSVLIVKLSTNCLHHQAILRHSCLYIERFCIFDVSVNIAMTQIILYFVNFFLSWHIGSLYITVKNSLKSTKINKKEWYFKIASGR